MPERPNAIWTPTVNAAMIQYSVASVSNDADRRESLRPYRTLLRPSLPANHR
jgi:hypothetical protein